MGASGPIVGVETFVGVLSEALPRRSSYIHFPLNPQSPGQRSRISINCLKTKPFYLPLPLDEIHFVEKQSNITFTLLGAFFSIFIFFILMRQIKQGTRAMFLLCFPIMVHRLPAPSCLI